MRLKAIKLAGFKSFVDPTTVSFPTNMSAIVGPNGCGKSNIIDAVRWVMGESSARNLRGESMTDVIFNGSTARKPVGQASIELVFDNSEGKLRGEYAAYTEVSIKRRVTRDGQSQYFINGSKCRRKDVTDLFLGTGLGPRSYAIIEQGMISRLIESRPEDLRIFLEEAAGISRYKERRKETESRIRRTQENLERLKDVREELGRQLEKLQRQARDAVRYKALKADERLLGAKLAALRWQSLDEQTRAAEAAVAEVEHQLEDELNARLTLDGQREAALQAQDDQSRALDAAQARFYDTSSRLARIEQQIQNTAERLAQLDQDEQALQSQMAQLNEELTREREALALVEEELELIVPELEELRFAEEEHALALEDAEQAMQDWQERWDAFNAETADLRNAAERAQANVQRIEQRIQDLVERRRRLQDSLSSLDTESVEQDIRAHRAELEEASASLAEWQARRESQAAELQETERQWQDHLDMQSQAERQLAGLAGQRASLETLIAQSASAAKVETWARSAGVELTPLAEQVRVNPGWEVALEAVLDSRLREAWITGDALPGDLPGQPVWFTTTAPVTDAEGGTWPEDALIRQVTAPRAVADWLHGARCAASLDEALARRHELAPGTWWVTPQGHQVGRDWLSTPAGDAEDSLLLRRQALEQVLQHHAELEARLQALVSAREETDGRRQALREALRETEQTLRIWQDKVVSLTARVESLEQKRDDLRARADQVAQELEETGCLEEDLRMELETAREAWDEAVSRLEQEADRRETLLTTRDDLRIRLDTVRAAHRHARERVHQLQLQHTTLKSRQEALRAAVEKTRQGLSRTQAQMDMLREQREALSSPDDALKAELDQLLALRIRQEEALEAARRQMEDVQHRLRELEQERFGNEQRIQTLRNQLEERRLALQALTLQRNAQREQLAKDGYDLHAVLGMLTEADREDNLESELAQIASRVSRLGSINLAAIEEYEQQLERKQYLDEQAADLEEALATLEEAIRKIDRETRARFKETFDTVNAGLQRLFPKVFGGGSAYLELTGDDLLETGVAIMARPPGKKNSTIHLLSGGEKALTAIALVFAIFQLNPAPFCMLDEVDAPLDDANVGRYAAMVKEMSEHVQFIYITHNKLAMEAADQLMGVTMHEPGVSRLVAVDVDEAVALAAL